MEISQGLFYIKNASLSSCDSFNGNIFNKGFSFYEVMRVQEGICLFLEDHIHRLGESLDLAKFSLNIPISQIKDSIYRLIKKNKLVNGNIKIILHIDDYQDSENIYAYIIKHYYPDKEEYKNGVETMLLENVRINPNIKQLYTEKQQVIADFIKNNHIYEALLFDEKNFISEGSRSNIFFVKGESLVTAPDNMVLKGITREKTIKIANTIGIPIIKEALSINELYFADAAFITGTSPKILPVKKINEITISTQNELMRKLMKEYDNLLNTYILSNKSKSSS